MPTHKTKLFPAAWLAASMLVFLSICLMSAASQQTGYNPTYWVWDIESARDEDWARAEGFGGIGFWAADRRDGTIRYYFNSPTLKSQHGLNSAQTRPAQ